MKKVIDYILISIIVILLGVDIYLALDKTEKPILTDFNNTKEAPEKEEIKDLVLVRYNDLRFYIPFNYKFKIDDNNILYISYKGEWGMNLQRVKVSYNDILFDRKKIKSNYEKEKYEVEKVFEKKFEGRYYLIFRFEDEKYNHLVLYTKLDKDNTYVIEFVSNLDTEDTLKVINPLIERVEKR